MNVVSYVNGDRAITDFPECSARPLARLVQAANDSLAGPSGFLSPADSVKALDLAFRTVGTADVPDSVVFAWLAQLLTNREWGLLSTARTWGAREPGLEEAIYLAASLHLAPDVGKGKVAERLGVAALKRRIDLQEPEGWALFGGAHASVTAAWQAVEHTALATTHVLDSTLTSVGFPIPIVDIDVTSASWHVLGAVVTAHSVSSPVAFVARAIALWRRLGGLDEAAPIDESAVDDALARIEG